MSLSANALPPERNPGSPQRPTELARDWSIGLERFAGLKPCRTTVRSIVTERAFQ